MTEQKFNLVFTGQIKEGMTVSAVKKNLITLFKMDEGRAERFFLKKQIIIKKQVNRQTAEKYKKAFDKAGVVCKITSVGPITPAVSRSVKPDPAPAAPPQHEETVCPACGYAQPASEECLKCGIIFKKFGSKQASPLDAPMAARPSPTASSAPTPSKNQSLKTVIIAVAFACVLGYMILNWWSGRPVSHGPGQVAPDVPEQSETVAGHFESGDYNIIPLANFSIEARVLSVKRYHVGREADLSKVDLALGWGPMSDEAVLEKLKIKQSNRFYFWSTKKFPIPRAQIETNSANMHMIPADKTLQKQLDRVRIGDVIFLTGYLVEVRADDGWHWKSSLTRNDTGNGACEVIWVESLDIQQ